MFGKKETRSVSNRLAAIKNAPPVRFSELQEEFNARKRKVARKAERVACYKFGMVVTLEGDEMNCVVRDISRAGAKIVIEGAKGLPSRFTLVIDGYRAPTRVARVWQNDDEAGVLFL